MTVPKFQASKVIEIKDNKEALAGCIYILVRARSEDGGFASFSNSVVL